MARINLRERIKQGAFLLDGAMGTEIIARGIKVGVCNDYLNIDSPDVVLEIHRAYLLAGSDAVLTNTFGANRIALGRHEFAERSEEVNIAAAQIARSAAGENRYVLGDIGPSGDFLEPLGQLKPSALKEAFAEQARGLLAGRVDGFIIETMTTIEEITIAVEAVKSVCDLPVFASMAFDAVAGNHRTMMGVDIESAVAKIVPLGVDAIGFNCGKASLDGYKELAEEFILTLRDSKCDVTVLAEPNAGMPELVEDKVVYNVEPDDFATAAEKIHSAGINIIGGCCGTGPKHIEAVAKKLKRPEP